MEKVSKAGYFEKEKKEQKKGEEAFFKQGEKPEVRRNMTDLSRAASSSSYRSTAEKEGCQRTR